MEGMNQMLLQAEERLDTLLKGLQAKEAKVAKCVAKSKTFAL
jgi:BMFP domain-containing protein YqiC